jgi:hypothetical protein
MKTWRSQRMTMLLTALLQDNKDCKNEILKVLKLTVAILFAILCVLCSYYKPWTDDVWKHEFCAMWWLCVSKHIFSQLLRVDRRFPILVLGTEDGAIRMWTSTNYRSPDYALTKHAETPTVLGYFLSSSTILSIINKIMFIHKPYVETQRKFPSIHNAIDKIYWNFQVFLGSSNLSSNFRTNLEMLSVHKPYVEIHWKFPRIHNSIGLIYWIVFRFFREVRILMNFEL